MSEKKPLGITELVLRDAHQSLLATRMRIDDMLPIAGKLDKIGFWSIESWGGATFDACIRYLGEDPWERIRRLKAAMPNTPQQMLFRGQNILGYRHYADDLVRKFVERCAINGVDVFRIFDALNDMRNLETAVKAIKMGAYDYVEKPLSLYIREGRALVNAARSPRSTRTKSCMMPRSPPPTLPRGICPAQLKPMTCIFGYIRLAWASTKPPPL